MSYRHTEWHNDSDPPINAANLNNIENGIVKNGEDILELQGGMRFIGETSILPESPSIGDVYQATIANLVSQNKVGDLLVFTNNNSWHVIPSGDEADGTVKYIEAGPGISINGPSGSMTVSGTISLDRTYTANDNRNGLMESSQFTKLSTLAAISETGSWNDLKDIPKSAKRPIYNDLTEDDKDAVVSQKGLKTLFDGKADSEHQHLIEDIKDSLGDTGEEHDLYYYLASTSDGVEDNIPVKAAAESHYHGNITSSGYLLNEQGAIATNRWLRTDGSGNITSQENIPSSAIRGYTLRDNNGDNVIDLSQISTTTTDLVNRVTQVETTVGDTSQQDSLVKSVAELKTAVSNLSSTLDQTRAKCSNLENTLNIIKNQDMRYLVQNSFTMETRYVDYVSIASNSSAAAGDGKIGGGDSNHNYIDISKYGYRPIAIYGYDIDNASNHTNDGRVGACVVLAVRISNDTSAYWQIKNNYNGTAYLKIKIHVVYMRLY